MEATKKKSFKWLCGALFVLSPINLAMQANSKIKEHRFEKETDHTDENSIGYSDIDVNCNVEVHVNNFVMLHVKNQKVQDITLLREQLEKCNDLGISVGLVLDTEAENLAEVYSDFDFLQAIVKEYKIDLPIYCNINNIMTSKNLNNDQRTTIIEAFIDKATRSDMYIGLYGTDTNLSDCKNYEIFNTADYDCYLVQDNKDITYDGKATIREDLLGRITASLDLSEVIAKKNLNNANKLVLSKCYKVQEGETYHSLGLKFGLSEEDLRSYNDALKKELVVGDEIYIPNLYLTENQTTHEVSYSSDIAIGIDISNYQTNIDWSRVKETSKYVIVEVAKNRSNYIENEGVYLTGAIDQIESVVNNDISLGLYFCITNDMKVSVYEERLENYFKRLEKDLEDRGIELEKENIPVFLDFEVYYPYNDYYKLMETFENVCKNHGFTKVGIYGNKSTLLDISKSMKHDGIDVSLKDTDWFVWMSGGKQYAIDETISAYDVTLEELKKMDSTSTSEFTPVMQQVTNVCTNTGAGNDMNHCDVSYLYDPSIFGDDFYEQIENADDSEPMDGYMESIEIDLNKYNNLSPTLIYNYAVAVANASSGIATLIAVYLAGKKLKLVFSNAKDKVKTLTK